jgi:HB1, ASXL, restriction endonuclease HTH domain
MAETVTPSDPYEAVVADIKAKIAQLQIALEAVEAIRAGQPLPNQQVGQPVAAPSTAPIAPGMFHGLNIVDAVKQLLAMRKKAMGTPEITEQIIAGGVLFSTETPGNTVGSVLHREAAKPNGGVINVGRGTWALPEWYPNPGRFRKTPAEILFPGGGEGPKRVGD